MYIGKASKSHDHEQESKNPEQAKERVSESSQSLSPVSSDSEETLWDKQFCVLKSPAVSSKHMTKMGLCSTVCTCVCMAIQTQTKTTMCTFLYVTLQQTLLHCDHKVLALQET